FWNTVAIKQINDVTRLQALVDKKKVVITEAAIKEVLRLDVTEGVDCLLNEEIFAELAHMGYEKPSTKLTFYKAFFSSQWKFLIHTILQSMSAKLTSWNEFSSAMASAVICLSTGRKFNFSKYIFDSLVRNVDNTFKLYMYHWFIQLLIKKQLGDLSAYTTKYTSPALTQKVFANMRRVGKGFSGVETPLFKRMIVEQMIKEGGAKEEHVEDDIAAQGDDTTVQGDAAQEPSIRSPTPPTPPTQQPQDLPSTSQLNKRVKKLEKGNRVKVLKLRRLKKVGTSQRIDTSEDTMMEDASNQRRMIDDLDKDDVVALMDDKEEDKEEEDEPAEVHEVVDVVTTAKLITEVVTAASEIVTAASIIISAGEPQVPAATITDAPVRVAAASTRKRKGVVIRVPEEESTTIIPVDTKSKDKGKGIMVEEPKPLKKKQQVEMDEEYARKMLAELTKTLTEMWPLIIPDGQAQVWKNQRTIHGQAKVKSWKLLESCGVHIITFTTTQLILLVERRYPLSRFTLDQMVNAVRLRVKEQSDMSLEPLRFTRQQHQEGQLEWWLNTSSIKLKNKTCIKLVKQRRKTRCLTSAGKQKLMLLDSAAEGSLMLLTVMSSASSAVTYTFDYTDFESERVFWRADEELLDGGSPRVIVYGYDGLPMKPVALLAPDYIPGLKEPQTPPAPQDEDEQDVHVLLVKEQPLPPDDSPTTESPGYVAESDPEQDPEEYEDDETEDGPTDYPINEGNDRDDDDGDLFGDDADDEDEDEEDEEEHLALTDSAVVIPTVAISLPPEVEHERLLSMPTPPPSPLTSLSPPFTGERLARCTAPSAHSSPPPIPSPLLPSSGCPTQIQTLRKASTQALIDAITATLPSPPLPPLPPPIYIPPPVDRRDDIPETEMLHRKRSCLFALGSRIVEVRYGIRDTWVDPAEAVPEIAPMTLGEVNTRVIELDELHELGTHDLYALLEDAHDSSHYGLTAGRFAYGG
nr:hypothetical protein [Tanacetum cinerariifolium]GEX41583.1 hypothetical protein [Tanacetum cinerariifolium]